MSYTPPFSITTRMLALVADIAEKVGRISGYQSLKSRASFRKSCLLPALEKGLIVMETPDKPTSRNQRYMRAR